MNRILLVLLLSSACFTACKKSNDVAVQVKSQGVIDDALVTAYLQAKGLPVQHVDTTGVCYIVDTLGTGNALFTPATQITVGYTSRQLLKGNIIGPVFATTDAFHPTYTLGAVIRGWQLGIPKIKQGGTVTLFVPSRYAYGPYAQPQLNLPANAILVFNITLFNITN